MDWYTIPDAASPARSQGDRLAERIRTFQFSVRERHALCDPVALAVLSEQMLGEAEEAGSQHDVPPGDLELRELLREVRVRPEKQAQSCPVAPYHVCKEMVPARDENGLPPGGDVHSRDVSTAVSPDHIYIYILDAFDSNNSSELRAGYEGHTRDW